MHINFRAFSRSFLTFRGPRALLCRLLPLVNELAAHHLRLSPRADGAHGDLTRYNTDCPTAWNCGPLHEARFLCKQQQWCNIQMSSLVFHCGARWTCPCGDLNDRPSGLVAVKQPCPMGTNLTGSSIQKQA